MTWIFVDDFAREAAAFADELGRPPQPIAVEVLEPGPAEERLLTHKLTPDGVLMDVDLSNTGDRESGPGFAQHIRMKQKAGEVGEYPIVRFSYRDRVVKNVLGDPTSDDLFDLKIQKEEVANDREGVQRRLIGLVNVYAGLAEQQAPTPEAISRLLSLDADQLSQWSHQGFHDRLLSALQVGTHVAASAFMRGFIAPTGLLLSEQVLSIRLGVDAAASERAWIELRDSLTFRYAGLGSGEFARWWARGLDDWWFALAGGDFPLSTLSIAQRIEILSSKFGSTGLAALQMPKGSAGDKPWRLCALTLEKSPVLIPVDPSESVRLTPRADLPSWVDPLYAALGPALQEKDFRLNRTDMERLQRKHRG